MVMFTHFAAAFVGFAGLFTAVTSQTQGLSITSPGGPNLWWVANSQNVMVWTCQTSPIMNFTVLINAPSFVAPLAIIGIDQNSICSQVITQNQANQPAGTGYTLVFANPLNSSDVYATSQPFEIKPLGSAYPPASATPTQGGSSTAASAGPTSSTKSGASGVKSSVAYWVAGGASILGLLMG